MVLRFLLKRTIEPGGIIVADEQSTQGVIVDEEAAVGLAHYLTEIGRLGNRTARDVGAAIQSGVNVQWGSAKVKQFQDAQGVGWLVDLSDRFQGEVLFGVVRTSKGRRHVVKVVDEDALRAMLPQVQPKSKPPAKNHLDEMPTQEQTQEQMGIDPKNPNGPTLAQQRDHLAGVIEKLKAENERLKNEVSAIRTAEAKGDALVRWSTTYGNGNSEKFEEQIALENVPDKLNSLISSGIKPEDIVVWSKRQQPKVRVELE
jgi:hypothetical protein